VYAHYVSCMCVVSVHVYVRSVCVLCICGVCMDVCVCLV